jgi:hypothetical protein
VGDDERVSCLTNKSFDPSIKPEISLANFQNMRHLFLAIISILFLQGCLSIARISDFPTTSSYIDFDKYSREKSEKKEPFWTLKTSNEFYLESPKVIDEDDMINLISQALKNNGYRISIADKNNQYVIGKRGLRGNEWNTRTGVYYKIDTVKNKTQIYINSRITQDITGSLKDNRAKKVGLILENLLNGLGKK